MIKLPKCPHCGNLMISQIVRAEVIGPELRPVESRLQAVWLCPETLHEMKPNWVPVQELSE